ncbi:MAG: hypothetical protein Q7K40_01175 [bacterium]|nr:hypothetical protein [bacterium]
MNNKKYILPVLVLLLIGATSTAVFFYQKAAALKKDPQAAVTQEIEALVATVGKLIILPTGETPTIATVSDPAKLKDQPFFAKAKSGDKVLIYQKAAKAYLYDVVNNKILEVAPLSLGESQRSSIVAPVETAPEEKKTTR